MEPPTPQKIPLIFFRTGPGNELVREWLKGLPEAERQAIGQDLLRAQWRWPMGMPLCRPLGKGLWEVPDGSADETDGACAARPLPRTPGRAARVYQENADNAG
jgi:hypothetical protein